MKSSRDAEIGAIVAQRRKALDGMTQQALADAMRERDKAHKWSQATVWGLEKGERALRAAEVDDLARVLDLSPRALIAPNAANQASNELALHVGRLEDAVYDLGEQLQRARQVRATVSLLHRTSAPMLSDESLPEGDRKNLRHWVDVAEGQCGQFVLLSDHIDALLKEQKAKTITHLLYKGAKGKKEQPRG